MTNEKIIDFGTPPGRDEEVTYYGGALDGMKGNRGDLERVDLTDSPTVVYHYQNTDTGWFAYPEGWICFEYEYRRTHDAFPGNAFTPEEVAELDQLHKRIVDIELATFDAAAIPYRTTRFAFEGPGMGLPGGKFARMEVLTRANLLRPAGQGRRRV